VRNYEKKNIFYNYVYLYMNLYMNLYMKNFYRIIINIIFSHLLVHSNYRISTYMVLLLKKMTTEIQNFKNSDQLLELLCLKETAHR